ncbi:MAG TPA: hypothetical protein PLZ43_15070 [bacterium]|nr:hypothetical protein [bacterium]
MKVWKVLSNKAGQKSGNLDKYTQYSLMAVVIPLFILTSSLITAILSVTVVFFVSFFVRRHFNGRADWLYIWYRLLIKPEGSYNLNERDHAKKPKR